MKTQLHALGALMVILTQQPLFTPQPQNDPAPVTPADIAAHTLASMSLSNLSCVQGKESWVLLQHEGEWRFGVTGERSPWLECARPFRQRVPFDWEGVTSMVRAALLERAAAHA